MLNWTSPPNDGFILSENRWLLVVDTKTQNIKADVNEFVVLFDFFIYMMNWISPLMTALSYLKTIYALFWLCKIK